MQKLKPCLWFDMNAEEAVAFYLDLFDGAKITGETRYPEGAPGPAGKVMTISFELFGQEFLALNGGPEFPFTDAVSFVIECESQEEIDRYWAALTEGGQPQQCGWVADRFGLVWQVVPTTLNELLANGDAAQAERVMQAMLPMVKLEIAPLLEAAEAR